jgi:hypothetical protein
LLCSNQQDITMCGEPVPSFSAVKYSSLAARIAVIERTTISLAVVICAEPDSFACKADTRASRAPSH